MTEWGGVGAVIVSATQESFRYITSVFVHSSIWHLLLVGGCCAVAGVLVERRCVHLPCRCCVILLLCPGFLETDSLQDTFCERESLFLILLTCFHCCLNAQ